MASALLFSKDDKLLVIQKKPKAGAGDLDCRHIPWSDVYEWESLKNAVIRAAKEEVWLDISKYVILPLPYKDSWAAEKTLKDTWEIVLCNMKFNRFKILIDLPADKIILKPHKDLLEAKWFTAKELADTKQVPGDKELLQKMGYLA